MANRGETLVLLLILCLVFVLISENGIVTAQSKTIVIPDDYPSIQQAIDNAGNGYTILVRSGIYEGIINQTMVINKTISVIGENSENTIINFHPLYSENFFMGQSIGWGWSRPLVIDANNVVLSGFTINSDGGEIHVNGDNTQILANIMATKMGLQGHNQTFALNTLTATLTCRGYYSTVYKNNATNCSIVTSSGSYASIFDNLVIGGGIGTGGTSEYELIYDNIIKDGNGIGIAGTGNIVANNTITNSDHGVAIIWGPENTVYGNVIMNCQTGLIKTETHRGNIFYANYLTNNYYGAKIAYAAPSAETILYGNNFINNIQQVNTDPTETIGGYDGVPELTRPLIHTGLFDKDNQGNFWSDYTGKDNNEDGIGDIPYIIDENRSDNYPLMTLFNISTITIQLPKWVNIEPLNVVPVTSFPPKPPTKDIINVFVNEVIDGDSFDTAEGYRIRLADIDAPELGEPGYLASAVNLELLLENRTVTLDIDNQTVTDQYGRYVCLAYLEHNSTHFLNINQYLVELSFAVIDDFTNNEFDPSWWTLYIHKNEIPEFHSWIFLPLFLTATVLVMFYRKHLRNCG